MVDGIFRLEISVDDLVLVHVVQSPAYLLNNISGHVLRDFSFFLQKIIQLTRVAKFKHEVNVFAVREEVVHFHNVRVIQEGLDFYLSHQLNHQLAADLRFLYLLYGADKICLLVPKYVWSLTLPKKLLQICLLPASFLNWNPESSSDGHLIIAWEERDFCGNSGVIQVQKVSSILCFFSAPCWGRPSRTSLCYLTLPLQVLLRIFPCSSRFHRSFSSYSAFRSQWRGWDLSRRTCRSWLPF